MHTHYHTGTLFIYSEHDDNVVLERTTQIYTGTQSLTILGLYFGGWLITSGTEIVPWHEKFSFGMQIIKVDAKSHIILLYMGIWLYIGDARFWCIQSISKGIYGIMDSLCSIVCC